MGKVIYGSVKLKGSLASGTGDDVLTRDATSKEVGTTPNALGSLTSAYIFVGDGTNAPVGVPVTGDIAITNGGVVSISSGVVVNADINASAAIAFSKMEALTASRALITDGSGFATASSVTSTELGYLSGVSSALQTQLNGKQATITGGASTIVTSNLTVDRALVANGSGKVAVSTVTGTELGYVSGVTSALQTQLNTKLSATLSGSADGDILIRSGGDYINLAIGSSGDVLTVSGGLPAWGSAVANGLPTGGAANQFLTKIDGTDYNTQWSTLTTSLITDVTATAAELNILDDATVSTTELNYLVGVSSSVQTQLNNKLNNALAQNAIFVGNSSNVPSQLAAGSNGQVLQIVAGVPQWQTIAGTGTVTSIDVSGGTTGLTFTGGPITTSGTITMAGTLDEVNGGTGLTSYTTGDIIYASGANTLAKLAVGTNGHVLTLAAGVPTWAAPSGGGSGTVTSVAGTTDRITITGTPTVAPVVDIASTYVGQTSITTLGTIATGTWNATAISIAKGGTALTALGTANQLLRVNAGATALEYFTPTFISGNQTITLSGDVSGSGTTAITATIGTNAVDDTKFRQSAGLSIVGRATNTTGNVGDITAASDNQVFRRSGTSVGFGSIDLSQSNAVGTSRLALSNVAQIANNRVLGNVSGSTGNIQELNTSDLADLVFNFSKDVLLFAHYISSANESGFQTTVSGAGSSAVVISTADPGGRPGILTLSTGTTTTGRSFSNTTSNAILLGYGEFYTEGAIRITTLSDGTDSFSYIYGLGDVTSAAPTDGVYFRYTHSENSGQWVCVTVANAVETATNLGAPYAVAAGTWYKMRVNVNSDASSVDFLIDDVVVATHTTNIPSTAGRQTGYLQGIRKTAGTTARTSEIDYTIVRYKLN
jgi:hypothetical protein